MKYDRLSVPRRLYVTNKSLPISKSGSERFSTQMHFWGEIAGGIAKVAVLSSVVLGTTLLIAYLQSVGAPFPALENALGEYLALLTAAFVIIFLSLGLLVAVPDYSRLINKTSIAEVFPHLYKNTLSTDYLFSYLRYYTPYLGSVFAFVIYFWCPAIGQSRIVFVLPILVLTGIGLLAWHSWKKLAKFGRSIREQVASIGGYLSSSIVSFSSWLILFQLCLSFIKSSGESLSPLMQRVVPTLVACILMVFHYVFSAGVAYRQIVANLGIVLALIALFYPGWSYLGGLSLRYLGVGGGIPISVVSKTIDVGSSQTYGKRINGCLIFSIGNELLFRPANATRECRLIPALLLPPPAVPHIYDGIIRLNRSDVVRIEKFAGPVPLPKQK